MRKLEMLQGVVAEIIVTATMGTESQVQLNVGGVSAADTEEMFVAGFFMQPVKRRIEVVG